MKMRIGVIAAGAGIMGLCSAGCGPKPNTVATPTVVKTVALAPISFTDHTAASGVQFTHNNGAFGAMLMPEIMGGGAAFIDYDGDGYPDLFLVNSRDWTDAEIARYKSGTGKEHPELFSAPPARKRSTCMLYLNNKNGTFTNVTKQAGLDTEIYGMGAAVGDYDNDGKPDIYVTALDRNYLFHNDGGKFSEVAGPSGVKDDGWSTSSAWVDYDKDGKLDLFVCHYVTWTPETDIYCQSAGHTKDYCTPEAYKGQFCRLFHNKDGKSFEDVSDKAGIKMQKVPDGTMRTCQGKSLGVAVADFNEDGWPDIVVANDTEPNYLYQNNKNGTFTEIGREAGIALSESAQARAAMGVDVADITHSGRDTIIFGNFSNQMLNLYENQGSGLFIDQASPAGVGTPSQRFLAFGTLFLDLDNDGWLDIFVSNGHVEKDVEQRQRDVTFKERPLLFRNKGKGQFDEIGLTSGEALKNAVVGRGSAAADIDLDGDVDVVMMANGGRVTLFRNETAKKGNSLRLTLQGTKSNRSGIGTAVEVKVGGDTHRYMVKSGSSYCSASELPLTLGLGLAAVADITVKWPSGEVTNLTGVQAGQSVTVLEGKGTSQAMLPGVTDMNGKSH